VFITVIVVVDNDDDVVDNIGKFVNFHSFS
jgi:hypothetical protein